MSNEISFKKKLWGTKICLAYYLSFAFVFSVLNPDLIKIPVPFFNLFELLMIPIIIWILPISILRGITRYESILYGSILFIIFTRLISLVFAENLRVDQLISIFRYVEYLFVVYIVSFILEDVKIRKYFIKGTVVFVILETILGAWIFLSYKGHRRGYFLTNGIYLQQIFIILISIGNLLYKQKKHLWLFLLFLMLSGVAIAQIRIGYIDLLLALFLYVIYFESNLKGKLIRILLLISVIFSLFLLLFYLTGYVDVIIIRIKQAFQGEGTVSIRILLWILAWQLFLSHPFTGIGTGGFARFQEQYLASLGFVLPEESIGLSTHNTVLGILAETGVIGFIAYLVYIFIVFKIFRSLIKSYHLELNYDKKIYTISVSICLLIVILMDWFAQGSFGPAAAILLGFALGILKERNRNMGGSRDELKS